MVLDALLGAPALLLVFVVPGLGLTAAVFPEKFRRNAGTPAHVEAAVLAVVGSVAVTILVGAALAASPFGFGASPQRPTLWVIDGVVGAVGLVVGWARRTAAPPPSAGVPDPVDDPAWDHLRALERLSREERRLARSLRARSLDAERQRVLEAELDGVRAEQTRLRHAASEGRDAS